MIALVAAAACGLFVAVGAAYARRRWVVVRVLGNSMAPAIRDGDVVVARRVRGPLRRGDVVVFAPPLEAVEAGRFDDGDPDPALRVKRAAALPGDAIPSWATLAREQAGAECVPAGRLVVKGDAAESQDSRHYGLVALDDVVGVVVRPDTSAMQRRGIRRIKRWKGPLQRPIER